MSAAMKMSVSPPATTVLLETILEALPIAVVALDEQDRFVFVNSAGEEFFGTDGRRLRAARLGDFLAVGCRVGEAIAEVRRTGSALTLHDVALKSPRLARASVDATVAPLPKLVGGVLLGLVARKPHGEGAGTAALELAGMAEVLAHEVKNPLSGIRGAAELLEGSLAGEDRELATLIRYEVDRIGALVDRVALLGDHASAKGAVNIHEVLRHVRLLAAQGFASGIRFREAYDPSLPLVAGNHDQLMQVLLNLVKNAAEAIGERGEIVLTSSFHPEVWRRSDGVRRHLPVMVAVRDNGPGIPEAERASLFAPSISRKPTGSGVGLALVAKMINEHGGLIEVESDASGTEFRLYLPLAESGERR